MSLSTSHSTLIDRGRKAGLTTGELYSALAGRLLPLPAQAGQGDCNGFVVSVTPQGHCIYRPLTDPPSR